ncbi:MAG: hypothetical protein ACLT98_06310 [Eggerthellaceae bacterium]
MRKTTEEEGPPRSPRAAHGGNRRLRRFGLGAGPPAAFAATDPKRRWTFHVHLRSSGASGSSCSFRRGAGGHVAQTRPSAPAALTLAGGVITSRAGYRRIGPSRGPRKERAVDRTTGWSATPGALTRGTRRWARSWVAHGVARRLPGRG